MERYYFRENYTGYPTKDYQILPKVFGRTKGTWANKCGTSHGPFKTTERASVFLLWNTLYTQKHFLQLM